MKLINNLSQSSNSIDENTEYFTDLNSTNAFGKSIRETLNYINQQKFNVNNRK